MSISFFKPRFLWTLGAGNCTRASFVHEYNFQEREWKRNIFKLSFEGVEHVCITNKNKIMILEFGDSRRKELLDINNDGDSTRSNV